jgi:GT2 family glycosyltransferase
MSFSVVIPSRNLDNLIVCIFAIRAAGETCEIVVVDGGLEKRRGWWLRLGPILIITGKFPFVFAQACNQGILATNRDDVILLNDDALLETPGGFTGMMRTGMSLQKDCGIIACSTNVTGYPAQHRHACPHERTVRTVKTAAFVGVYIPRQTLISVGLLDERFISYGGEDVDYCIRVRHAGLTVNVTDLCFVDHSKLPSTFRAAQEGNTAPGDVEDGYRLLAEKWGPNWRSL